MVLVPDLLFEASLISALLLSLAYNKRIKKRLTKSQRTLNTIECLTQRAAEFTQGQASYDAHFILSDFPPASQINSSVHDCMINIRTILANNHYQHLLESAQRLLPLIGELNRKIMNWDQVDDSSYIDFVNNFIHKIESASPFAIKIYIFEIIHSKENQNVTSHVDFINQHQESNHDGFEKLLIRINKRPWLLDKIVSRDAVLDLMSAEFDASSKFKSLISSNFNGSEDSSFTKGFIIMNYGAKRDDSRAPIPNPFIEFTMNLLANWMRQCILAQHQVQYMNQVSGLEEATSQANRMLQEIRHDLNTSLNNIQALTSSLTEADNQADRTRLQQRIMGVVYLASSVLHRVNWQSLMTVERNSFIEANSQTINLCHYFRTITGSFIEVARSKGISYYVVIDDNVPDLVKITPDAVTQVIYNLLSNAFKYTYAGHVTIKLQSAKASTSKHKLIVTVIDSGIGIQGDKLKSIFSFGYRADENIEKGAGLGLHICLETLKAMGGDVDVESTPGEGSTFTASFVVNTIDSFYDKDETNAEFRPDFSIWDENEIPGLLKSINRLSSKKIEQQVVSIRDQRLFDMLHSRLNRKKAPLYLPLIILGNIQYQSSGRLIARYSNQIQIPICKRSLNIMLIDDMPEILAHNKKAIENFGYSVYTFDTPFKAIESLTNHTYDVVISDYNLNSSLTGLDILKFLRMKDDMTPFFIISADDSYGKLNTCMSMGANSVLRKPIRPEYMMREIKNSLHGKEEFTMKVFDTEFSRQEYIVQSDIKEIQSFHPEESVVLLNEAYISENKEVIVKTAALLGCIKDHESLAYQRIRDLCEAYKDADRNAYYHSVHSIKNMSLILGLSSLTLQCDCIKKALDEKVLRDDIEGLHLSIIKLYKASLKKLSSILE